MTPIETAKVTPLNAFKPLPHPLVRVQFRGISGQALRMESLGRFVGQELCDDTAAVNRGAIPDDTYAAGHLSLGCSRKGTTSAEWMAWSWQWQESVSPGDIALMAAR